MTIPARFPRPGSSIESFEPVAGDLCEQCLDECGLLLGVAFAMPPVSAIMRAPTSLPMVLAFACTSRSDLALANDPACSSRSWIGR